MQHSLFRQRQKRLCVFLENKSPTAYFFPHVVRKNILFIWRQGPAEGLAAEAVAGAAGAVPGRFGAEGKSAPGEAGRQNPSWFTHVAIPSCSQGNGAFGLGFVN